MKTINNAAVARDGDRLHELLLARRDLVRETTEKVRAMDEEIAGLNKRLLRVNDGEDFLFVSGDGYFKRTDIGMTEGKPDLKACMDLIVKLRRKVPRNEPQVTVIVRHLSDEESDLLETD